MIQNDDDRVVFFDIDGTLLDTSDFAETARKAAIGLMVDNGLPLDKDEAYGVLKTIIREKGSNYGKHFNVLTQVVLGHEDPMLVALGMITYHNVKMALLRPFPETIDTCPYYSCAFSHCSIRSIRYNSASSFSPRRRVSS